MTFWSFLSASNKSFLNINREHKYIYIYNKYIQKTFCGICCPASCRLSNDSCCSTHLDSTWQPAGKREGLRDLAPSSSTTSTGCRGGSSCPPRDTHTSCTCGHFLPEWKISGQLAVQKLTVAQYKFRCLMMFIVAGSPCANWSNCMKIGSSTFPTRIHDPEPPQHQGDQVVQYSSPHSWHAPGASSAPHRNIWEPSLFINLIWAYLGSIYHLILWNRAIYWNTLKEILEHFERFYHHKHVFNALIWIEYVFHSISMHLLIWGQLGSFETAGCCYFAFSSPSLNIQVVVVVFTKLVARRALRYLRLYQRQCWIKAQEYRVEPPDSNTQPVPAWFSSGGHQ